MNKLERIRQAIDEIIRRQPDEEESRCGFVHLYGVAATCTLLALKRGLDPIICSAAGMLHDISTYKLGDHTDHPRLSAIEAEGLLAQAAFAEDEVARICLAISRHSAKDTVDDELSELLKDADVLQHYLYNSGLKVTHPKRLSRGLAELGLRAP